MGHLEQKYVFFIQDQSFSVMEKILSDLRNEIMREVHKERQELLQEIEKMNAKIQVM